MIEIPIWMAILLLPSICLGSILYLGWTLVALGSLLQRVERYVLKRGWIKDNYPCD